MTKEEFIEMIKKVEITQGLTMSGTRVTRYLENGIVGVSYGKNISKKNKLSKNCFYNGYYLPSVEEGGKRLNLKEIGDLILSETALRDFDL